MKKVKVEKENLDGFLELVRQHNGDIKSLNQALEYVLRHWDELTAAQADDEEKQLLKDKVGILERRIKQLEKQLKEKDQIIESLREQDPQLLKKKMEIDWKREELERKQKLEETKLKLKEREMQTKAAIEVFKPLCKSGKLPETICQGELGEFIRKQLGLDEILEEGED
ncbi:hypothetical protein [Candidatus Pyrohabitans sp.]